MMTSMMVTAEPKKTCLLVPKVNTMLECAVVNIKKVDSTAVFSIQKIVLYLRLPLLCVNALSVSVRSISGHFCSRYANSKRTERERVHTANGPFALFVHFHFIEVAIKVLGTSVTASSNKICNPGCMLVYSSVTHRVAHSFDVRAVVVAELSWLSYCHAHFDRVFSHFSLFLQPRAYLPPLSDPFQSLYPSHHASSC